ncbi:MAG: hypothetical protein JWN14_2950 [Chthonomonadales bacterium]|nr:hypothetical protein [Chthonomonadales bacterium]
MRALYRTVWIVSLLAIVGMSCWFLTKPPSLPVVAPMVAYVSEDKSLAFQYPGNWKPQTASSQAVSARVAFDPNSNTHFAVDTNLAGSLMGDIAKSGDAGLSALQGMPGMPAGAADKQKSPLEMLHEASLHAMAKNKTRYPDFEASASLPIQVGGVEALSTDFAFKEGGVWGKRDMIGTYVTILTKEREVSVKATTSKALQKTMKPIFEQMINSIHLEQTGG